MKTKMAFFQILILISVFWTCQLKKEIKVFDIDGESKLVLKNELSDSIKIKIENWYQIPWQSQMIDTILKEKESIELNLIIQGYSYYTIEIGEKEMRLFSKPNSIDSLIINKEEILFLGELENINKFLLEKSKNFQAINAEWTPRANLTHGKTTTSELLFGNDTLTQTHLDYINSRKEELPSWYIDFENKRLQYLNIDWKIRSVNYRRVLLNKNDSLPSDFLKNSLGNLAIEDENLLGNETYMLFLSSYVSLLGDSFYSKKIPKSKRDFIDFYDKRFKIVQDKLHGTVKDVYLTYRLSEVINQKRYLFNEAWLGMVEEKRLQKKLREFFLLNPILPKGSKLPFFSLLDFNNTRHESKQFKNKILLINFWATWCKPCIKDFPYENELVEQFKQEPVEVINICIESDSAVCKSMIDKLDLQTLNLISTGNWDEKLTKDFGITGLPHSTLVDWNGKIVQNKCPRASEGVDELIEQLLIETK